MFVKQSKICFENLNKCLARDNFYDAEVWCIKETFETLKEQIDAKNEFNNDIMLQIFTSNKQRLDCPTYFANNSFLDVFQRIVDTYGIPRYQEINPAIFTAITFPFLFGIMFGDIGHGAVLMLVGFVLILKSKELLENIETRQIAEARYLIFLMGFFAFYCGFLYNDFMALMLPIFGHSCYDVIR